MKTWKQRIAPIVSTMQPAARVAERVMQVAVHLRKPTLLSVVGVASTGLSALAAEISQPTASGRSINLMISTAHALKAFAEAGVRIRTHRFSDSSELYECTCNGFLFSIDQRSTLTFHSASTASMIEWMRQVIDRTLPIALDVRALHGERAACYESQPLRLTHHTSRQAELITAATLPLLANGRCVLLDGRPGVGKTTLAQIIARESGLGRVVMLSADVVGYAYSGSGNVTGSAGASSGLRDELRLLSPGVIIVDDVDKVRIPLDRLEDLRNSARLVVLTANNGEFDDVLDGAIMRAGRVDEVFTIAPVEQPRAAPFDALDDTEWAEVSQWPVAYLNEVRLRLQHRPGDVRLDDLRQRLTRKTRSGEVLR